MDWIIPWPDSGIRVPFPAMEVKKYNLTGVAVSQGETAYLGGSVAEWLACRTQARKSTGSNRSRDAVE